MPRKSINKKRKKRKIINIQKKKILKIQKEILNQKRTKNQGKITRKEIGMNT